MALAIQDWRAPDPTGAVNAYLAGVKLQQAAVEQGIQQQQFAQKMAQEREQQQRLQAQSQASIALQLLQEQRLQRASELQAGYNERRATAAEAAAKARADAVAAASAPYRDPYATATGAPSIPATPATKEGVDLWTAGAPGSSPILGKITDYGQGDDPTPDSYTRAGKSAIGNLRPDSMALSSDLEAKMRAAGVKIGTPVTLTLSDGSQVTRFWDDRTAKSYNGKPLTGRVDLYSPDGKSPLRDMAVVDIRPADVALGNTGETPSTKALPPDPAAQIVGQAAPAAAANPADIALRNLSANLAAQGVPQKLGQQKLAQAAVELATQRARATTTKPDRMRFPDGSLREKDPETNKWVILGEKPQKDDTAKEERSDERITLSKLTHEREMLNKAESMIAKIKPKDVPKWPWKEGEKYYKQGRFGKTEINQSEYDEMMSKGSATEWGRLDAERKKRRDRIAALEGEVDKPAGGAAPAVFQTEEEARKSGAKSGDIVMLLHPRTGKPARFQLD